ncbi:hypothetical protein JGH11_10935 [Dysgonomonas sp. Marseille-P4677]|uniref:hypothetical protein n=1 Tax=Dysgonomonas sp. Marseille-P4677 TaxID=2364790 RepID=UPI001913166A|nr:hypothetical protein [Dysgonomonas sp. Marseille-P4677]MBK5721388.1 hypothetical protein [Dysgonomonas sp. Marseille-P4677]
MKENKNKPGRGYAATACRAIGVSRTVYETAKKKHRMGESLTVNELAVLVKYNELIEDAKLKLESLKN